MKMIIKLLIVCLSCLLGAGILYFIGILIYGSLTGFKPEKKEILTVNNKGISLPDSIQKLTFLTWNIGYAGLGKEMDFFYDGGRQVRPSEDLHNKYWKGIEQFLKSNDTIDFIFLQEIDFRSKRSYYTNEFEQLNHDLPSYASFSALNYKSGFVPVPFSDPMGKVNSGICVFTKYQPEKAERIATPGSHGWPKSLFILKRCLIESRYNMKNGKELVAINLHNSAFGDEKELREAELGLLKKVLTDEYEKGNYVIAGGDWNQNPPGFDSAFIKKYKSRENWPIQTDYLAEGWKWAFDPTLPTNRNVDQPFNLSETPCTILDFFVVSPNITVKKVETIDQGFEYSDHQPVLLTIELN